MPDSDLVDGRIVLFQVLAALELKEDHWAFLGNEGIARRIAQQEGDHVPGAGRIAQVVRVVQNDRGNLEALHACAQPGKAPQAQRFFVRGRR